MFVVIEDQKFAKKKELLKKRIAESEWLNDEYKEEVKALKAQLATQGQRLAIVEKSLEAKQAEF